MNYNQKHAILMAILVINPNQITIINCIIIFLYLIKPSTQSIFDIYKPQSKPIESTQKILYNMKMELFEIKIINHFNFHLKAISKIKLIMFTAVLFGMTLYSHIRDFKSSKFYTFQCDIKYLDDNKIIVENVKWGLMYVVQKDHRNVDFKNNLIFLSYFNIIQGTFYSIVLCLKFIQNEQF